MQKIFIDKNQFQDIIELDNKKSKHILKVLKMTIGDKIVIICDGKKFLSEIYAINPLKLKIVNEIYENNDNNFIINIYFGAIKAKNLELAIKKATELNATNFYVYYFQYSQNSEKYNLERINTIIKSSAEQSNRNSLMNFEILNKDQLTNSLKENDINFIAHFVEKKNYIINNFKKSNNKIGVLVGPEGGFSEEDLNLIKQNNNCIISLTQSILRSETALIYILSILNEMKNGREI